MFTKKTLYMLICLSCIFAAGNAQNVVFKFNNGNPDASYAIADLRNFTYSGTNMVVKRKTGATVSYPISTIVNYRYTGITSSVRDLNVVNAAEVSIFPNPFRSAVHIKYELAATENVSIEILDMTGRSIKKWPAEKKKPGSHELIWQTNDSNGRSLQSGTYICRIQTSKGSVSKMMIME
ncbi:MAG: T9SS type A sorting domain-containing protein [Bacteroidota bacterium]